ncbi:MAG: hypothetical protein ABJN22_14195 [Litorimonas sp.]
MRELTKAEIEEFDFSGRVPELGGDNYQLIGLIAESPSKTKRNQPKTKRSTKKLRFARSA